jgi:Right handed beta helix region
MLIFVRRLFCALIFLGSFASAGTLYVSPQGDDGAAGAIGSPLKTPQAAFSKMASGDTIYIRGGTYSLAAQVKPSKAGTETARCKLWAYPGEKPVFDFTGLNDRGLYISKDYWHVRGIEVKNAGSNGICLSTGGNSILEGCVSHDNGLEGIKLTGGAHDNLILNCDSYRNYDAVNHGEDADGFAAKSGIGTGNVFRGCRSWLNSDDGWDFYGCPVSVTIDSCWSFRNGINVWNDAAFAGDGNAFKMGGAGDTAEHMITRSLAFDNAHNGFDQNYNNAGQTMYNCTAFRNGTSNFSFYQTPTAGKLKKHVLKNNISYLGGAPNIDATALQQANSWQGFTAASSDFVSLDTALALAPRNADYSLPKTGFLKLQASSQFVDKGVDVGLAFNGKAPDLGAFETTGSAIINPGLEGASASEIKIASILVGSSLQLTIIVPETGDAIFSLFDLAGKKLYGADKLRLTKGANDVPIKRLFGGVCFYVLTCGPDRLTGKVMNK